jgi:hypothetical protein
MSVRLHINVSGASTAVASSLVFSACVCARAIRKLLKRVPEDAPAHALKVLQTRRATALLNARRPRSDPVWRSADCG